MGASDLLIAVMILAASGWILYRSLWKSRGRCPGCSGCGTGAGAPVVLKGPRRVDNRAPPDRGPPAA